MPDSLSPSMEDVRPFAGPYTRAAKWFHWLTLPPLGIILLSGLTIRFINEDAKMAFYTLHESLGLLVLVLSIARLLWRLRHPWPPFPAYMSASTRLGASVVHNLLYVLLIVQPVLGFFTTNAHGFPQQGATAFLGFVNLPKFMAAAPDLALRLHWAHSLVGWFLIPLIVAHVLGVLYHHVARQEGILLRML